MCRRISYIESSSSRYCWSTFNAESSPVATTSAAASSTPAASTTTTPDKKTPPPSDYRHAADDRAATRCGCDCGSAARATSCRAAWTMTPTTRRSATVVESPIDRRRRMTSSGGVTRSGTPVVGAVVTAELAGGASTRLRRRTT